MSLAESGVPAAACSSASTSAKSAGSSKLAEPPLASTCARSRSRTRPCSSVITASTGTRASPAKAIAHAAPNLDVGADGGDLLRLLLQLEYDLELALLPEDVVRREPPADGALPGLVWIAVARVLGNGAVAPVPLDARAVEVGV